MGHMGNRVISADLLGCESVETHLLGARRKGRSGLEGPALSLTVITGLGVGDEQVSP